jgi:O-antigen/teichoic acid export membrane protein
LRPWKPPFALPRDGLIRALLGNAGSLVGSIAVTSLLGFPYWWLAARAFPAEAVGFAAATVSAMTLLGTVGMLGLGTLLTGELPHRSDSESLIATALTFAACGGLLLGLVFSVVAPGPLGLHGLSGRPLATLLFAGGVALTSVTMVIDQAVIGLLRGGLQLWRNILFSVSKLAVLAVVGIAALSTGGLAIYATWVIGLALSLVWLALATTHQGARIHHFRPRWSLVSHWRRAAIEHHVLNLALQAPALVMPLVVTAVVSVTASAYFYTAQLITSFLAYGAIALSFALYAVGVRDEANLATMLRFTLRLAFGTVLLANLVLLFGAHFILGFFGAQYAAHAATPLRIIAAYALLAVIKDHYVAIARIRRTVLRAATLCAAGAVLEVALASVGGTFGGLTWLALGALAALSSQLLIMSRTVIRELRRAPSSDMSPDHADRPIPEPSP